ncbi:MAG: ATP-binding protein [Deinococcales bacterium]
MSFLRALDIKRGSQEKAAESKTKGQGFSPIILFGLPLVAMLLSAFLLLSSQGRYRQAQDLAADTQVLRLDLASLQSLFGEIAISTTAYVLGQEAQSGLIDQSEADLIRETQDFSQQINHYLQQASLKVNADLNEHQARLLSNLSYELAAFRALREQDLLNIQSSQAELARLADARFAFQINELQKLLDEAHAQHLVQARQGLYALYLSLALALVLIMMSIFLSTRYLSKYFVLGIQRISQDIRNLRRQNGVDVEGGSSKTTPKANPQGPEKPLSPSFENDAMASKESDNPFNGNLNGQRAYNPSLGTSALVSRSSRAELNKQLDEASDFLKEQNLALRAKGQELLRQNAFREGLAEFISESLREGLSKDFYQRLLTRAIHVIPNSQAGSLLLKKADDRYHYEAVVHYDLGGFSHTSFSSDEIALYYSDHKPSRFSDFSLNSAQEQPLSPGLNSQGVRQLAVKDSLAIPVRIRHEAVAFLTLDNFESADSFDDSAISMAEAFAAQVGVVLNRLTLEAELTARQGQIEKTNAELLRANRLKSEFLANMSHELRTPLTAILGFAELLREELFGGLNDKQHQYVNDIFYSGNHLLSLINDILDLSKIEAGHMEVALEYQDIYDLVTSVLNIMKERARKANVRTVSELPDGLDRLYIDGRKIKQVLFNLISNAVKFTPVGGTVTIKASRRGAELIISVIDTGIGISQEDRGKLFKEFSQLDSSLTKEHEGTGLGLALSQRLVELHGGRIWVESVLGLGSDFSFSLPYPQNEDQVGKDQVKRAKILLIANEDALGEWLEPLLTPHGYELLRAHHGLEALELLKSQQVTFILSMTQMPIMDGYAFLERYRAQQLAQPVRKQAPVIFLLQEGERQPFSYRGAQFMQQPFEGDKLLAKLDALLGHVYHIVVLGGEGMAEVVREVLELGHQVTELADGEAALDYLSQQNWDLLLSDFDLGDMSAIDLLFELSPKLIKRKHLCIISDDESTQKLIQEAFGIKQITVLSPDQLHDKAYLRHYLQNLNQKL